MGKAQMNWNTVLLVVVLLAVVGGLYFMFLAPTKSGVQVTTQPVVNELAKAEIAPTPPVVMADKYPCPNLISIISLWKGTTNNELKLDIKEGLIESEGKKMRISIPYSIYTEYDYQNKKAYCRCYKGDSEGENIDNFYCESCIKIDYLDGNGNIAKTRRATVVLNSDTTYIKSECD